MAMGRTEVQWNGRTVIRQGEAVYPGHPIVVALFIMQRFGSFEDANGKGTTFPRALEDCAIPGAGGNVYQALEVLRRVRSGIEPDVVFRTFSGQWVSGRAGGIEKAVEPGQAQADSLKEAFTEMAREFTSRG